MGRIKIKPYTALFPCPVILVSCIDESGNPNIITLAWAGNICSNPPQIGISIRPNRYSYQLIKESGEFVVNIPGEKIIQQTDYCGIVSGKNVNKFQECDFTPEDSEIIKAPLIKECPVNIECSVRKIVPLGTHDLFIAEVLNVLIDKEYVDSKGNYPDYEKIVPFTYCPQNYLSSGKKLGFYGFSKKIK
ncbi:MAG: flavin reductase family protein [Actinomycetia bacterium]|nr:flavin reductase family protein [Actinomycetes bacterium]